MARTKQKFRKTPHVVQSETQALVEAAQRNFMQENGREMTPEEVSKETEVAREVVAHDVKLRKGLNAYTNHLQKGNRGPLRSRHEIGPSAQSPGQQVCTFVTPDGEQLRTEGSTTVQAREAMLRLLLPDIESLDDLLARIYQISSGRNLSKEEMLVRREEKKRVKDFYKEKRKENKKRKLEKLEGQKLECRADEEDEEEEESIDV